MKEENDERWTLRYNVALAPTHAANATALYAMMFPDDKNTQIRLMMGNSSVEAWDYDFVDSVLQHFR